MNSNLPKLHPELIGHDDILVTFITTKYVSLMNAYINIENNIVANYTAEKGKIFNIIIDRVEFEMKVTIKKRTNNLNKLI